MADNDDIGAHSIQRDRCVDKRLTLFQARLCSMHVHYVGAKPLAGNFETQQCPCRILKERIDLCQAVEPVVRCGVAAVMINPSVGFIEQEDDLMRV